MTTCYVKTDQSGKILEVNYSPHSGPEYTALDDEAPDIAKYLRDPTGSEDRFPALHKWQLWLAALELEPPISKAAVLSTVEGMADMSFKDKETVRIMVEDAQEYSREDPRIDLLGQAMGIPASQMDDLWRWAAQFQSM